MNQHRVRAYVQLPDKLAMKY